MRQDGNTYRFDADDEGNAEDPVMGMWRLRNEAGAALAALQETMG